MAQLVNVLLNKGEAPSLGFRIQGGKDFGTPLIIQKVNYGSPAEKAGLQAGDSVIKINNVDVFSMRHKDAQDVIIRAGPAFEITVQRGGSTWKPSVIPTTPSVPKPQPASNNYSPVTKTSLAANPQSSIGAIGTGHNVSAKPFNSQVNGTVNGGPKFVNKQYNTPLGLYSEQSIAETLSAQAEVLSTGVLGVNFKKNEKNYDASNSEVFRMVQEADKEPKQQESEPDSGVVTAPLSSVVGLRHVTAPETKPTPPTPQLPPGQNICAECERLVTGVFVRIKDKNLHVECFKCATCGTSLKNVGYYNINNKLYCDVHAKLAARSNPPSQNEVPVTIKPGGTIPPALASSLAKNRLPSSTAPLSPNQNQTALPFSQSVEDVSSTPNNNETIANVNTSETFQSDITTVDSGHQKKDDQRKRPSLFGTKYDPIKNEGPISFSAYMSKSGTNFSSPRPFSSVSAPLSPPTNVGYSTLPKASPVSVPFSSPAPSVPSSEKGRSLHNVIWPPPPDPEESDTPTATPLYFPPPSHLRPPTPPYLPPDPQIIQPPLPKPIYSSLNLSSQNQNQTTEEIVYKEETVREETTTYSESLLTEEEEDVNMEQRMSLCSAEVTSIVDRRVAVETIESAAETQMLVESLTKQRPQSPPPIPPIDADILPKVEVQTQPLGQNRPRSNTDPRVLTRVCVCTNSCCNATTGELCASCPMRDLKRPNDFQKSKSVCVEPKRFGSPIITGVSVTINNPGKIKESKDFFTEIPVKKTTTALGSALVTAPKEPFQPVSTHSQSIPLPEETQPYLPPERPYVPPPKPERKESIPQQDSAFISALRIAPERPWTPTNPPPLVTKKKTTEDPIMKDLPKPTQWMSMVSALTTASDRPYSPFVGEITTSVTKEIVEQTDIKQEEIKKMKQSQQEMMRRSSHNETALPKPYVGTRTNTTRLEKFEAVNDDRVTPQMHFPPISDELKASYEYHADYSEIKSEISSQIIEQAHLEETTESVQKVQEKSEETKCSSCQKSISKEKKIEKQTEETVLKKPMELSSLLQKREYIPQYQMSLNYDETLELPHHKNIKKLLPNDQNKQQSDGRNPNVKPSSYQYTPKPLPTYREPQVVTKPVTTIQPGQTNPNVPAMSFQTIDDERPPKTSFSPRPGSLTPSMINKPPSTLPYYQANLVYTEMPVPEVNVFDPKSPAISRSPSPCPDRAPSPFGRMSPRPRSPAAGPPPNPLKQGVIPKFTKEDHMKGEAVKNISTYIPQYREKIDGRVSDADTRTVTQHVSFDVPLRKSSVKEVECHKKSAYETQGKVEDSASCTLKVCQKKQEEKSSQECGQKCGQQSQKSVQQIGQQSIQQMGQQSSQKSVQKMAQSSQRSQQSMQQSMQQKMQQSVQQTVEEIVQESVQTVQQRSMQCSKQSSSYNSQFEKASSALQQQQQSKQASLEATKQTLKPSTQPPFRQVKNPEVNPPGVQGMRVTNPQPIYSPFLQKGQTQPPPVQPPAPPTRTSVPKTPISAATAQPNKSQQALTNKNVPLCGASANVSNVPKPNNAGVGGGKQAGAVGFSPKRGRGVLNVGGLVGARIAVCGHCHNQIRGPFITALGKIWCPDHFVCTSQNCKRPLADIGFIEEQGQLYCEYCFEQYLAPNCSKCGTKVKGDCLKAIGKNFHPECFNCSYCGKLFGNSPFFLEDGQPYCENDWNEMFTTKCFACGFPVEAGDRWVEALNNNYHSQCFNCTMCKKNLEGQSFFAKGGRPFCKNHAR
nr:PDZ and LIM domain protein Zasp-like isoform X2 [Onthophagus taurus]